MKLKTTHIIACLLVVLSFSCKKKPIKELIICTQVPANTSISASENILYPEKARLVAFSIENPKETFKILSSEFYSASSPDVFYTGETVVFSAQKNKGDVWQVWEINLKNFKTKPITSERFNCTDPMYLPTGEILFSGGTTALTTKCHALFTCKPDGSNVQQITFQPHTNFSSSLLKDGRILYLSQQEFPKKGEHKLMAMRPDGTKLELFYQGETGVKLLSRAQETTDEKIVFVQSNPSQSISGQLISLDYKSPFHSKKKLTNTELELISVFPIDADNYLVSVKQRNTNSYGISLFSTHTNTIEKIIYEDKDYHTFEPVINQVKERARKLPSAVNMRKKTGLILCQNVHVSSLASQAKSGDDSPVKIELLGLDKKLATVEAEEDGSLYLKVKSDTPFRFRIVNSEGEIVRGPSDWLWVRPNERRGCVGCHADRELVPKNYVPLAVKKDPVSVSNKPIDREEAKQ